MNSVDVLIAGAGPTGLALACGLRQHGITVRVVDGAEAPATTSRANILHARGVEVLNRLGALGDLRNQSVNALEMTMHVNGRAVGTLRFGEVEGTQLSALIVSQAEIEAELRRRLGELGIEVEWGRAVVETEQDSDGSTATLGSGEKIHTSWLVGCDGAHSTVRQLANIAFPGVPVADQFLLADVHADWDRDRSGSAGWYHRDGVFLAMPMRDRSGQDDVWRLLADTPVSEERLSEPDIVERLGHLLHERTGLTDVHIRETKWASMFRIHRRLADRYREGRILLAGDAAHIHSPLGGQGMNTGIGDAENLAWKLALVIQGRADGSLLDTYESERRPLAEDVLRNTTVNTKVLLGQGAPGRFLRDRILTPLTNLPTVQRWATYAASQLWVSYRRGPLGGSWRGPRPRPGERVRDVPCLRADGGSSRLHTELRGKWAVLGSQRCTEAARELLGDAVVRLTPTGPGDTLLIRPDAHLAWRGDDPAQLRQALASQLGSTLKGIST